MIRLLAILSAFCFLLSAVAEAQSLRLYRTHYTRGYYVAPGSLDEHLWSNWEARTNGRNALLLSTIGHVSVVHATNALWNTNWFFYGTENFTGQNQLSTNAAPPESQGLYRWKKSTLISRVAILQSGHNMCHEETNGTCGTNLWFLFVDPTNGQHWRRAVHGISRNTNGGPGDYYVAALNAPVPTNIVPIPVVFRSVWTNKLRLVDGAIKAPTFYNSQFSRTEQNSAGPRVPGNWFSAQTNFYAVADVGFWGGDGIPLTVTWTNQAMQQQTSTVTNGLGSVWGADSGSPTFMCVSNRLLFLATSGYQCPGIADEAQFLRDYVTAITAAGYTTNDYPVQLETLSQFPDL